MDFQTFIHSYHPLSFYLVVCLKNLNKKVKKKQDYKFKI